VIYTAGPDPVWDWDANVDAPTCSPSVRIFTPAHDGEPEHTECHYFLKAGKIEFCGDSDHPLKGQTVDLPDFPENYGGFD
jgi:hypothetical protein